MHKKLAVMCLAMVNRKTPMLLHDNARPHVAQQTLDKLNELKIETVPHPLYQGCGVGIKIFDCDSDLGVICNIVLHNLIFNMQYD